MTDSASSVDPVIELHDRWSIYQEKSSQVGDGFIRWVEDSTTAYVTDIQAGRSKRGHELLEFLRKTTGKPLFAVGVVDDSVEFWDKMEERDVVEGQTAEPFMEFFGRSTAASRQFPSV